MENEILFLCTGNYYRSRFAEAVFNHEAARRGLAWKAFSRGLAIHLVDGPISPHTEAELARRGIPRTHTAPGRQQAAEEDFHRATLVIALKTAEHRPLMGLLHPEWADRIRYWDIHDLDFAGPEEALPLIEAAVIALIEGIKAGTVPLSGAEPSADPL